MNTIDIKTLLPELKNIINYEFYHTDPHTGDILEFNRFFGRDAEERMFAALAYPADNKRADWWDRAEGPLANANVT